jgi:hypothetical protein
MDPYYDESIMPQKHISIITKVIFILLIILLLYFILNNRKSINTSEYGESSIMEDPIQKDISSKKIIIKQIDNEYTCKIYPRASYKMTVKIKGINTINFTDPDWRKKLSKYDLGVVWGKLADKYYDEYIDYSQINRVLVYTCTSNIDLSLSYISTHLSNNHTIPANDNVLKGIASLKEDDICYIEGKLVDFEIFKDNKIIAFMDTSLVRTDSGDGACETMYIEKIILGDKTYE